MKVFLFTLLCVTVIVPYGSCEDGDCGPNAHYDECPPEYCPPGMGCTTVCRPRCVCDDGYEYDSKNICVKKALECGENEIIGACANGCINEGCPEKNPIPPPQCSPPAKCVPGCLCVKGYYRRKTDRKCVLKKDCNTSPSVESVNKTAELTKPILLPCGPHEKRICKVACYFDDCQSLYFIRDCARPIEVDGKIPCKYTCVCESGYLRWNGVCIPKEQCPPVECINDENAIRGCSERCGRTCKDYKSNKPCILSCTLGCDCRKGYVYDEDSKKCVLPEDCPKQCGKNEFWNPNGSSCPQPSCDNPKPDTCNDIQAQPGCYCKKGYIRNSQNKCIRSEECKEKQCGENEFWNPNGSSCPQPSCDNPKPDTCNDIQAQPGCYCKKGYIRNSQNKCIRPEECDGEQCGENEFWNPNGTSCPQASCDYPNPEPTCNDVKPQPGCYCNEGYIRNPENKCILPEDCKDYISCNGGNQTYVPCTFRCPQDVCPTSDWPMACKPARNCPGGCGCLPGYRWNENDECIYASDCPEIPCTQPNTYWHPCSDPDLMEDCTNRQNQEDLPPPAICKPWCICQQGYFRDYSNNCVAEADCPP